MKINSPSFKPSHGLLTLAVALATLACDPQEAVSDPSSEPLAAQDPDQIGLGENQEANPHDNGGGECSEGYKPVAGRLCVDPNIRQPERYLDATIDCRDDGGRVCSVEDLAYLYEYTSMDANFNPKQGWKRRWIGNIVGNAEALCGDQSITQNNDPDQADFDGVCSANEKHAYWCCRERSKGKWGGGDDGGWEDDDGGWEDDGHDGGWDSGHDGGWDGN